MSDVVQFGFEHVPDVEDAFVVRPDAAFVEERQNPPLGLYSAITTGSEVGGVADPTRAARDLISSVSSVNWIGTVG